VRRIEEMWLRGNLFLLFVVTVSMGLQNARATQMPAGLRADLADGKTVYRQKCAACHFDTSREKKIGPGLAGLMKRPKFKNGMVANDNNLRRVIEFGGKDMPGFGDTLKQKQIRDLIAYVRTL
jgi:mono/diheme cytochrome c family protein